MDTRSKLRVETLAVHAGQAVDMATGAVAPPIYLATTFERDVDGGFSRGFSYSRTDNPNRQMLERCLAELEGAEHAIAFASGLGVANAVLQALRAEDHVIAPRDVYHGVRRVLERMEERRLLTVSFVDATDPGAVEAAVRESTRLIWVETPSNPLLQITDLAGVAGIAKSRGILTVCDSTFASPVLSRPLEFGIDMVMHSTTKYIGGHSDVTGGVLLANAPNAVFEEAKLSQERGGGGGVPSPFDCWLTLRGVATLPLRVRAQSAAALVVARFLEGHAGVDRVFYPGLESHAGYALAARQMTGFGGVLSFTVRGGEAEAMAVAGRVRIFTRATSLGGTHSLVEHRASIEGAGTATPGNLLRVSIGLENVGDLVEDLGEALGTVGRA